MRDQSENHPQHESMYQSLCRYQDRNRKLEYLMDAVDVLITAIESLGPQKKLWDDDDFTRGWNAATKHIQTALDDFRDKQSRLQDES